MDTIETWDNVRPVVCKLAEDGQLIPFLGAAISHFQPTCLPLGDGLLRAAIQGAFPNKHLFREEELSHVEQAIFSHSPEVILQGLAEALPSREKLTTLYNKMCGLEPNPLHQLMATALRTQKVPAILTTNQDRCIEDASVALRPIYAESDFGKRLDCNLYQFHGAIGGISTENAIKRNESLTFTLNSMGPNLSETKHNTLEMAFSTSKILFLGYSGSDPDIWYSLDKLLTKHGSSSIYWCIRDSITEPKNRHIARLRERHPDSIIVYQGDMLSVLTDLSRVWTGHALDPVLIPTAEQQEIRLQKLRSWADDLTSDQREIVYGWLLDSVGLHGQAGIELEKLLDHTQDQQIHMLAALFAGYARREVGEHKTARQHLQIALHESKGFDLCRDAQAAQKLGESLSAFESVRFWQWWPNIRQLHSGAAWLETAISVYSEKISASELAAKQLGRAGPGNAKMNLGQLYRRVAAFTPGLRPGLARRAKAQISDAMMELEKEKDLRSIPMALAAITADDSTKTLDEKIAKIDEAIEYSEQWNQDQIQIGSAYFAKGRLLARKNPQLSEACYLRALIAFQSAGMNAEIARTQLELAFVLSREAHQIMSKTQGSAEWKFGLRVLGTLKVISALVLK